MERKLKKLISVNEGIYREFKSLCALKGESVSVRITELMKRDISDEFKKDGNNFSFDLTE